jgi:hypothetical protein
LTKELVLRSNGLLVYFNLAKWSSTNCLFCQEAFGQIFFGELILVKKTKTLTESIFTALKILLVWDGMAASFEF